MSRIALDAAARRDSNPQKRIAAGRTTATIATQPIAGDHKPPDANPSRPEQ